METVEQVLALIEDQPADAELYQRLGKLHLEAGRAEEARVAFVRSLELDPKDAFTHLYLGNCSYRIKMYPEALLRYQLAAELMPDQAIAYSCQADVYRAQGRFDLAQQALKTAADVAPNNELAQEKLATWSEDKKGITDKTPAMIRSAYRNDQAATTVLLASRWLQDHPNDIDVIFNYAEMLYKMTRYEEAIRIYQDAIKNFEDRRWGLYNQLGRLHRYRGDLAQAELWFQKAVDEDPDEVISYVFLGATQARQGKLTRAEETHRRGTRCSSGLVDEAYLNLGLVLRGQSRFTEAGDCFRKALELCPNYTDASEALKDVEAALTLTSEDEIKQFDDVDS